jgi:hypothetical protein
MAVTANDPEPGRRITFGGDTAPFCGAVIHYSNILKNIGIDFLYQS